MSGLTRIGMVLGLIFLLTACGDGDAVKPWDVAEDAATDTTDTTTDDGTTPTASTIVIGSGSGASFTPGLLNIAVTSLSAGGSTSVSASLADADGNLHQDTETITFTSDCVVAGLASIDSPVSTSGGVATTTYIAQGCSGNDTIVGTATVDGVTSTASGTLTVQPAIIGSLQFVSAEPPSIGISGFGLIEVSKVSFRVLDTNGNPVANQLVNFSLNTQLGGITLSATSATSDITGLVQVDVQSGTVATVVRVTATLASNPAIKTQSDGLVISTGIADQNSMSLSVTTKNPEAAEIDGTTVTVTVRAADHFNNPVPDGTAVSFTTEGGQIQPQCLTTDGACSVTWTSSNPRPANLRTTILATMIGEESFVDTNGNGVLDNIDTFEDVPEAFRDDNENGSFDLGSEEFLDFNSSGGYDLGDGEFNGVLCCDAAAVSAAVDGDACFGVTPTPEVCSTAKNIHVRGEGVLVMSCSSLSFNTSKDTLDGSLETVDTVLVDVYCLAPDGSWQIPPSETAIGITTTNGGLESLPSLTVPSTNVPGPYSFTVRWKGDSTPSTGSMRIQATVPSGLVSGPIFINLID